MSSGSSKDEKLALIALALTKRKRKHRMWVRDMFKSWENGRTYRMVYELLDVSECQYVNDSYSNGAFAFIGYFFH